MKRYKLEMFDNKYRNLTFDEYNTIYFVFLFLDCDIRNSEYFDGNKKYYYINIAIRENPKKHIRLITIDDYVEDEF